MVLDSKKTNQRMVKAALELIYRDGFDGLKLRQVAAKAGVNLGLFHYHFGSKDDFVRAVLQETYDRFFHRFRLESKGSGPAWERLRGTAIAFGCFMRDNRLLMLALLRDSFQGHRPVLEFVEANLPRHIEVFRALLQKSMKEGSVEETPLPLALSFLLGAVNMANLAVGLMEHAGVKSLRGKPMEQFEKENLSDEAIALRVDMALRGLGLKKAVRPEKRK